MPQEGWSSIGIRDETKASLEKLKQSLNLKSLDLVITHLETRKGGESKVNPLALTDEDNEAIRSALKAAIGHKAKKQEVALQKILSYSTQYKAKEESQ